MLKLLSKNIIIYGSVNTLKSLVPLFMLPILTMHLSTQEFGLLSLIETTILFLTPFILLNINSAINVEYFKLQNNEIKDYITNALLLSLLSFLFFLSIFLIFKEFISSLFSVNQEIVVLLVVFSFLRVVSSVVLSLFQVTQQVNKFAIFSLFQTIVDFTLSYLFVVLYQHGYLGRLEGIYISFFIASLIGMYLLVKMDYLGKITFNYSKDILKFGLPLIPHAIGGTVIAMSDRYFISYFCGNEEVGLYTVAYQISALMLLISISVNQAWSPMLFRMLKDEEINKVYLYSIYLFVFFIFCSCVVYISKDLLFYIFVDENFYGAKEFFFYLLVGFVFQSFYFLVINYLFFQKRTALLAKITVFGAILNMILNYYFIQIYGTIGVAYATAITWFVFFILVLVVDLNLIKRRLIYE